MSKTAKQKAKRIAKRKLEKQFSLEKKKIQKQQQPIKKQMVLGQSFNRQQNQIKLNQSIPTPSKQKSLEFVINYVADRNGCGYYRCIWPFELLATYKNLLTMNCFIYQTELQILSKVKAFRFQRQATDMQLLAWNNYMKIRQQKGFNFQLHYEIDDLLMEIQPHNEIAYRYFDQKKKENHLQMLRTADLITFSTEPLKEIYVNDYGINPDKIKVIRNHLPQFMYSLPYRSTPKEFDKNIKEKRPRILWGGSASHIGKGGDLEFIIPMIKKTVDEYNWVFQGVYPKELESLIKEGKIEFINWTPIYGLANMQFYRAKADICIAPLTPSRFNSAKSDLKYLESCALGSPCICTSFEQQNLKSPYDRVNAEICLEPDADIWKTMIDHLVDTPDYYIQTIKSQYEFLNGRWMENNLDEWADTIK